MKTLLDRCPEAPEWQVDWAALETSQGWIDDLRNCPQDAVFHAEGDVWTHTRLTGQALVANETWRHVPARDREILFAAALLHDVGKPARTREDELGRVSSAGHAGRGAILARQILWRQQVPFAVREQIVALVRYHQQPFFLLDRPDPLRLALRIAQVARCDLLALLARADVQGRICSDANRLLELVELFAEFCREQGCYDAPHPFPDDHSRFVYFQRPGRDPTYPAFDDTWGEVVLLSGLPGAGKDRWTRVNLPDWPVISLDDVRQALGIAPTDAQGAVIAAAREQAREYLRCQTPFVWNATNLSRAVREQVVSLCTSYRARVRIVYLEVPEQQLLARNRGRQRQVPSAALARLLNRWQVPDPTEAHRVEWVVSA